MTRPVTELADLNQDHDWWNKMSAEEQREYVRAHPRTRMKVNAQPAGKSAPGKDPARRPSPDKRPAVKPHAVKRDEPSEAGRPTEKPADPEQKRGAAAHLHPAPESRDQWPAHIQALKLPPAWTDVRISSDPDQPLQAIGRDAKGRPQYVYSEEFARSQAAAKFARIQHLSEVMDHVERRVEDDSQSDDPRISEHARCLSLIMRMGLRPGGESDTGADKRAYGATTLEGRHVVTGPDGKLRLQFVGKKGVDLDLKVPDAETASMLRRAAVQAGPTGRLFPRVSAASMLDYAHSMPGGGFKTKDLRTLKGTREAHAVIREMDPPRTEREYRRAVSLVAKRVSQQLGNTPAVALASYISPVVFSEWRANLEQGDGRSREAASDRPRPRNRELLPDVHVGPVGSNHRALRIPDRDPRDDDSLPRPMPRSTIAALGLDPRDLEE